MKMSKAMLRALQVLAIFAALTKDGVSADCRLTAPSTAKATYHSYSKTDPDTTTACQLQFPQGPGPLMVTAVDATLFKRGLSCGDCLKVTNTLPGGSSAIVQVVDLKGAAGLDMSPDSFRAIAGASNLIDLGSADVTFYKVPCTSLLSSPNIKYRFKAGSDGNPYLGFMVVDHLVPMKSVAIAPSKDGPFTSCSMDANNWWICSNHAKLNIGGYGPIFHVKMESTENTVIYDAIHELDGSNEARVFSSSVQFPSPSNCGGTKAEYSPRAVPTPSPSSKPIPTQAAPTTNSTSRSHRDTDHDLDKHGSDGMKNDKSSLEIKERNSTESSTAVTSTGENKPCLATGALAGNKDADAWCATVAGDASATACTCGSVQTTESAASEVTCTALNEYSDQASGWCKLQCSTGLCPQDLCRCETEQSSLTSDVMGSEDDGRNSDKLENSNSNAATKAADGSSSGIPTGGIVVIVVVAVGMVVVAGALAVSRFRKRNEESDDDAPDVCQVTPTAGEFQGQYARYPSLDHASYSI